MLQIYQQRKNLAFTLQDARSVVSKLEMILGAVIHVLLVFAYLIIFDVSTLTVGLHNSVLYVFPCCIIIWFLCSLHKYTVQPC